VDEQRSTTITHSIKPSLFLTITPKSHTWLLITYPGKNSPPRHGLSTIDDGRKQSKKHQLSSSVSSKEKDLNQRRDKIDVEILEKIFLCSPCLKLSPSTEPTI
jgi:hypothetical protein